MRVSGGEADSEGADGSPLHVALDKTTYGNAPSRERAQASQRSPDLIPVVTVLRCALPAHHLYRFLCQCRPARLR